MCGQKGHTAYPTENERAYRSFKLISLTMTDSMRTIAVTKKRKEPAMDFLQGILDPAEVGMQTILDKTSEYVV